MSFLIDTCENICYNITAIDQLVIINHILNE